MKKGFTYLELVIVIVVIGILALVSLDRLKRDGLYEAADQLLTHIRYTQHLAMIDDRFDPDDGGWRAKQYRLQVHGTARDTGYTIYRDLNNDQDANNADIIITDPTSQKLICGQVVCNDDERLDKVDLEVAYGVTVTFTNSDGARQIMFDNIGRPLYHDADPLNGTMEITLTDGDESVTINIEEETGYSYLDI